MKVSIAIICPITMINDEPIITGRNFRMSGNYRVLFIIFYVAVILTAFGG